MHAPVSTVVSTTEWWWVRHAPVLGDSARISGQRDVDANFSESATVTALDLLSRRLPADAVWVTSNLSRAIETAARLGGTTTTIEPDLAEQDFGLWTGRTWNEIGDEAARFWDAPADNRAPGGESFADVCGRVNAAIERLGAQYAGRDIIAVAHAGTIRAALTLASGLMPADALALEVQNLSLTRIDHTHGGGFRVPV